MIVLLCLIFLVKDIVHIRDGRIKDFMTDQDNHINMINMQMVIFNNCM